MRTWRARVAATLASGLVMTACHDATPAPKKPTAVVAPVASPVPAIPPKTFRRSRPPDIFYIVLDDYGGARALREQIGFDETPFLDSLRALAFVVPEHPTSNYPRTEMSLASQQNLDYLQALVPRPPADGGDQTPLIRLLAKPAIVRFLRARGYRYVHIGSSWPPTQTSPLADEEITMPPRLEDVARMVGVPYPRPEPDTDHLGTFVWDRREYLRVLFQFHELPRIAPTQQPAFVFAHILAPHYPHSFTARGGWVPMSKRPGSRDSTAYADQIRFVDRELLRVVRSIIRARPQAPPVIVLQSDEGFWSASSGFGAAPDVRRLQAHFGTFAAYHLPGVTTSGVYDTITPVNVFRLVFDDYFGAGLPLLPDRNYTFPDLRMQWTFRDVTTSVQAVS